MPHVTRWHGGLAKASAHPMIKFIEFLRFLLNKMLGMVLQKLFTSRAGAPQLGQSMLPGLTMCQQGTFTAGCRKHVVHVFRVSYRLEFTTEFPAFNYLNPFWNHKESQC